ncbi:MAG: zinc ribbon domain-containing protein [Dehalococcoidia bacterium]|nr:zinc ribbon domain-containing protein [Dehalococcoidia bacterium]
MPIYEYYCESCDSVFEALRPIRDSGEPSPCPKCQRQADRILPTTFASMSLKGGWKQRVPFHHAPVRADEKKPAIARLKPKTPKSRKQKTRGQED